MLFCLLCPFPPSLDSLVALQQFFPLPRCFLRAASRPAIRTTVLLPTARRLHRLILLALLQRFQPFLILTFMHLHPYWSLQLSMLDGAQVIGMADASGLIDQAAPSTEVATTVATGTTTGAGGTVPGVIRKWPRVKSPEFL